MGAALYASCDRAAATAATAVKAGQPANPVFVLATCILASSLAFIDGSVVNVGLPAIGADLRIAQAASLQWIINAYLLPLSALTLLGGAAGDRFGRKRLLVAGTVLFALASLACMAAPSVEALLLARSLQGVGAALLMPNSLAILGTSFAGVAKGRAIGIWAATGAAMGAVGPVLGGWLIDVFDWRAIFLINLPLAASAIALALRYVPSEPENDREPLDLFGGLSITAALGAITYGLTIGSGQSGWTRLALSYLACGVLLLLLFLGIENRRGDRAMAPLSLFASRNFIGLTLLTLLLYGALGALFVLVPYLLINSGGFSAAMAGASLLPLPLVIAVASPVMGALATRTGARIPLTIGPLIVAGGFLLLLRAGPIADFWTELLPGLLVIAVGMSAAVAPLTTAVLDSVDAKHSGSASGLNSATARTGGLVATALLGSALSTGGSSLVANFHVAMFMCAVACVLASAALLVLFKDPEPEGSKESDHDHEAGRPRPKRGDV